MSAFNQIRYNNSKFNIEAGSQVWAEGASVVKIAFSYAGNTFNCFGNSKVAFNAVALRLDKGRVTKGKSSVAFDSLVKAIGYFNLKARFADTFESLSNLSQEAYCVGTSSENFEAEANLSQEAYADGSVGMTFDIDRMNLSQVVWESADLGEVFTSAADVIALIEYVCEFPGLTLKPGDELIIDANLYNVFLNTVNAVHYQKGDWLDNLNRNTQHIVISGTGASRLTAEILYTERYL